MASPHQKRFEDDLGTHVLDEFEHYADIEMASIAQCRHVLMSAAAAE